MSSLPAPIPEARVQSHIVTRKVQAALGSTAVLVVVPTLDGGAADAGAVELVRGGLNPELSVLGVVLTMYDKRNQLSRQVVNEVVHNFPGRVFDAVIPRTISVAEAPSFGKTILQFDPGSKAAQAYRQLAQEIIRLS